MADNSLRTPGSGETIASDDVGGVKFQRVKLTTGADGTAVDTLNPADAMVAANSGILPSTIQTFNETTYDRMRGNTNGTLLALAARTVQTASPVQTSYNARGVQVNLHITAASGTGGLKPLLVGQINSNTIFLNPSPTAIIATGDYLYELYPASTAAGVAGSGQVNQRTSAALPRNWFVLVAVNDASSYTYQLDYALII